MEGSNPISNFIAWKDCKGPSVSAREDFSEVSLQAFEEESFSGDIVYQQLLLQILVSLSLFPLNQIICFCLQVKSNSTKSK